MAMAAIGFNTDIVELVKRAASHRAGLLLLGIGSTGVHEFGNATRTGNSVEK